jgi:hypothetical protein
MRGRAANRQTTLGCFASAFSPEHAGRPGSGAPMSHGNAESWGTRIARTNRSIIESIGGNRNIFKGQNATRTLSVSAVMVVVMMMMVVVVVVVVTD